MSLKPNALLVVTVLFCGIAIVGGGSLFLSEGDTNSIAIEPTPTLEPNQDIYPLSTEKINALVNVARDSSIQELDSQPVQVIPLLLPSSLLGSTLPLTLDVSESGELIINKKIQHLFDFYLSAMGEESLDIIVTRIKHSLTSQLVDPALTQGMEILTGYLQYLNEVSAIKQQFEQNIDPNNTGEYALDNVIQVREMVLDARTRYLDSDVIDAFFGQADEYEDYMLSLAMINKNNELDTAEKQSAKAALDAAAPEWLLAQQRNANLLNKYRDQYKTLQEQGASQTELKDFTQQSFSPEVADRLATLDEKRQLWQAKLDEYKEQLAVITSATNNSDNDTTSEQQQLEITQLREIYFTPQEIKRVSALDGIKPTAL
ncbi:lipase secretion chaperone [Moritella viscosa]|uniref:Lipase chaperone n=1 Tax=Moritella viscosa TaxID=80854 RepID=A0ABY1HA49_9GAMM|nr:lipase secretion chaperone [Moritella viscosa]SGY87829.1 Lipase chaperone [Moritella viscosa]SGY87908.1 Lipase chaperone [Moritella viscosa]SHO25464.1 Lipase chaperone [Moritella viscosa]